MLLERVLGKFYDPMRYFFINSPCAVIVLVLCHVFVTNESAHVEQSIQSLLTFFLTIPRMQFAKFAVDSLSAGITLSGLTYDVQVQSFG